MKTKQTSFPAERTRSRAPHYERTADFWALYTIFAFPTAVLVASSAGLSYIASFCLGISASLLVILANALLETRLWLFTDRWGHEFLTHDFSYKLLVVACVLLLIVESVMITLFFIDGSLDGLALRMIAARRCGVPTQLTEDFCMSTMRLIAQ